MRMSNNFVETLLFFFSRPGLCHWLAENSALGEGGRELARLEDGEEAAVNFPREVKPTELDALPSETIAGPLLLVSTLVKDAIS